MATTDVGQSKKNQNYGNCFSCCLGKKKDVNEIPINNDKPTTKNKYNINKISNDILMKHNVYRARHRVPSLVLNKGLCNYAQNYAEKLAQNNGKIDNELEQSQNKYGKNIYHLPAETDADGFDMVKNWYEEIKNYNFSESKYSNETNQFTQVIWKDSKRIGVGLAKSISDNSVFIVVVYDPPGNILNQFKKNIFPSKIEILNNTQQIEFNKFEIECLEEHNRLRFLHNCPPLELNSNLCKYAQEWVNKISISSTIGNRKPNNPYGENIYCSLDDENGFLINSMNGSIPVKFWYTEIVDYDFREPKFSLKTEHFSQLIWKNSKQLGVAKSEPINGRVYVVANYDPPGNRIGKFKENVFPITLKIDNLPIVKN